MCIIVSFKSCGEVARELKFVPFALPDSGTVVESSNLIFLSLLIISNRMILAHSAPVSAARMAILFGFPFHNSSTLLACPWGPRKLNGLDIAIVTLDALAAVGVNHRFTSTNFILETNFALDGRFFKTLPVVAAHALVLIAAILSFLFSVELVERHEPLFASYTENQLIFPRRSLSLSSSSRAKSQRHSVLKRNLLHRHWMHSTGLREV